MARPMASSARPFEVVRLSRKPSPASRSASTAWSICSAGSGGSQVPNARMRCGESCASSSEVSPLICGRLSPAAHEIRICGSANSSARKRSAWTCRSRMSARSRASLRGRADARAHQQDRGDHRKAEQRQRGGQDHEFLAIEIEPGRDRLHERAIRWHGPALPAPAPSCQGRSGRCVPVRCTTAGSDASPRSRPTWFAPNRTTLRPAFSPPFANRMTISPIGSRAVRVQSMNANRRCEKNAPGMTARENRIR